MSGQQRQRLVEVFTREYEATRNLENAVAAVATTVKAQLEMRFDRREEKRTKLPREVKRTIVLRKYEKLAATGVLAAAAHEFGIEPSDITYRWSKRSTPCLHARWSAWVILRKPPFRMSTPEIAHVSRVYDHTVVLYGLREIQKRPDLLAAVERIEAVLRREETPALAPEPHAESEVAA